MKKDRLLYISHEPISDKSQKVVQKYSGDVDILILSTLLPNVKKYLEIRNKKYKKSIFLVRDINYQRYIEIIKTHLLLAGAREKYLVDFSGKEKKVTLAGYILLSIPKLLCEMAASILVIIYCYFHLTWIRYLATNKKPGFSCVKKIAYFRTDHWFGENKAGGSIGHIAGVINAFYGLGYDISLISSDRLELVDNTKIPLNLVRPDYGFFNNIPEIPELRYNFQLAGTVKPIFRAGKPDLIYQRYSLNDYTGLLLSKKYGIPFLIEYNGSFVWMGKHWGKSLKFRNIANYIEVSNLKCADLIVVVSDPMKKELLNRGIEGRKILVNPNGVNPDIFNPNTSGVAVVEKYALDGKCVVGFIGTFGKWHGTDILARSIRLVVDKVPNVHFLFIGDGVMKSDAEDIIKNSRAERFVTFTGLVPQHDAHKYLAACDILVNPTVPNPDGTPFFGSPTKLFEYMAMGKGIVASDLDQIGEVLKNDHSAILVKPGDVDQLAAGIIRLVEDKELRERLGRQAREDVVNKYTWKKNVENVLRALEKLGDEGPGK